MNEIVALLEVALALQNNKDSSVLDEDDNTTKYIEGATYPEYIVTADDIDKIIALKCVPMDDQGRELVL
ncbi:hypothetical protein LguiA_010568 [Lonicera macranthoides]